MNTPITPLQVTLVYTVLGIIAALLFAMGGYLNGVVAGIALARQVDVGRGGRVAGPGTTTPSRVGRFADSVCDYVVNAAVFFGLAMNGGALTIQHAVVAVVALESATWQGSTFSYYYVYYRKLTAGDTTSELHETEPKSYPWDDPRVVQRPAQPLQGHLRLAGCAARQDRSSHHPRSRLHRSIGTSACSLRSPSWAWAFSSC